MHRHAEDVAVDAQLLMRADTEAVGGQQRQLVGAVAQHEARRQLGGGGGLAHAGGSDQRQHAALRKQAVLVAQHRHLARQFSADPRHRCRPVVAERQPCQQRARQLPGEARADQPLEQRFTQRIAGGNAVGRTRGGADAGELALDHRAHRLQFAAQVADGGGLDHWCGRYIDLRRGGNAAEIGIAHGDDLDAAFHGAVGQHHGIGTHGFAHLAHGFTAIGRDELGYAH
ncbi:hypothetical protein D3C72_1529970 [compost metagenome]